VARPTSLPATIEGTALGDFVVVERLGEGGHGVVYRAEQVVLGREAVIKVLHERHRDRPETIERFLREARLASRLDHPYAAHVYAFGAEPGGVLWIAMEYVRGTPLDRWLTTHGPMPLDRFVPFLERLCEVVHTAHEQGIVHRDIKPANVIVLERAGRLLPKLLDFGVAQAIARPGSAGPRSNAQRGEESIDGAARPGAQAGRVGTPAYMAPELWIEAHNADARTDLYAVAVLAYEVVTGRPPFRGTSVRELAVAHASAPPPPLEGGRPAALDDVLARALAKRPADRFASLLDFAAAFRAASGIAGSEAQLPRMNDALRDALIGSAPQPIAEAVSILDGARNAHQALDALWQVVTTTLRYAALLALAARTRTAGAPASATALERLRALRRRAPSEEGWFQLLAALAEGIEPEAHPLPELVVAATRRTTIDERSASTLSIAEPSALAGDALPTAINELLALRSRILHASGASEATARELLAEALAPLEVFVERFAPVLRYPLVAVRQGSAEQWMGLRRPLRPTIAADGLDDGDVVLFGRDRRDDRLADRRDDRLAGRRPLLRLSPLFAVEPPTPGAPPELFLFDGQDRLGARFVAPPAGFERHDDRVWAWLRGHVPGLDGGAQAQPDDERAPYRGLSAFSPDDAEVFFGRERETATFVNRLRTHPVAAVVGPSGVGKSSFVQAGVIPALPAGWRAITSRPGPLPLAALAARLCAAGMAPGASSEDLRARLAATPGTLGELLRADGHARGPVVLVIDQLEELFTLCHDAGERTAFAEAVIAAARTIDDPVRVVFTLRDDFLVPAEQLPALRDRIGQAMQLLTVPAAADLVRILVEPAHRAGYDFEDAALARDMVADVAEQPGALAVLAFTAAQLWDQRDRHFKQLTRGVYRALGGVAGAFARHAEHTLAAMTADERRLTREAFRHLVTTQNTRAVLDRGELRQLLGGDARADSVIEKLVGARLLVTSDDDAGDTVEIVHEALLVAWPRLTEWRREDDDGARLRELLRAAARQWDERGRPSGMLWRGDALLDYTRWRARHTGPLTDLETAFGRASVEASARGRRLRRGIVAAAFAVLATGIVVLLWMNALKKAALDRAEASDRQLRDQVIALNLEHGRQRLLAGDAIRAAIFLDAAVRAGGQDAALSYLLGRVIGILDKQRLSLVGHTGTVRDGRYSPDGEVIVTAAEDRTARVWSAITGRAIATLRGHDGRRVFAVDVDRTGARVVTASDDRTARIWDARTGRSIAVLAGHDKWVWVARFSPDGTRIVTASIDGTARLWDAGGQLVATLRDTGAQITDAVFAGAELYLHSAGRDVTRWDATTGAPHGRVATHAAEVTAIATDRNARIASVSLDGAVQIHGANGALVAELAAQLPVRHMAFSADGTRLALAGGVEVEVWDVERKLRLAAMRGHAGKVTAIAFAPDGRRLASSSDDGTARLWDAQTGQSLALIPSLDAVKWLAFSRDGGRIAIGGAGGASVWDSRNDARRAVFDLGEPVSSVTLRGDGGAVVACGARGTVRAWSVRDGAPLLGLQTGASCVAAITPDGAVALTGDSDGKVRSWDAASGQPLRELAPGAAPAAFTIGVSPDGQRLVTGHDDNDARIWEIATGRLLVTLGGHRGPIFATAWSPDGGRIATCSNDSTSMIWNAITGDAILTMTLDHMCPGVAFDRAGERVATASGQVARVWTPDGKLAASYEGHQGNVNSVLFGPPGLLVTASADTTIQVWDLAQRRPIEAFAHPDPVDEADISLDRSVLAARSGSRVYLWDLVAPVSPTRVREIIDALPSQLQGAYLVPGSQVSVGVGH
jgi:WD40 repeat protein/tRNA A-37 threonylcarbamoyl transferase component Bud32